MIEGIFVFIFGSMVGSFLNVCIYRMPLEQSIIKPRSYCPHCKRQIFWYDNIPFISYLMLRGRCRFCKQRISLRYFLVELISASVFLLFYSLYGLSFHFIFYTLFTCLLIIATFVDIAHRIIPDEVSIGGIVIGFLLSVIRNSMQPDWFRFEGSIFNISSIFNFISSIFIFIFNQPPALDSLFGILLGGGIIYFTGKGFDWIWFKRLKRPPIDGESESMGGGDVKLLAMIGAFLGCKIAVLTFFMAPFFGAIVGIANLITKKQHTIPYGPFLSLAAFISLFWADAILRLIFFR